MIDLRPDDHARIRRVFRYMDDTAPVSPDLEAVTTEVHQLTSTSDQRRRPSRGPLVMLGAAVTVLIVFGVGLAISNPLSDSAADAATMQPGPGATPAVEDLLVASIDGYIAGSGRHVASYVGPPGGSVDFYIFEQDNELEAEGQPTRIIRSQCIVWGISEQGFNGHCGTVPLDPVDEPMVAGVDIVEADQSGRAAILTPPEVVQVVIQFRDGTEIVVEPANGVSYAVWDTGGFPVTYEAISRDGSRQDFE